MRILLNTSLLTECICVALINYTQNYRGLQPQLPALCTVRLEHFSPDFILSVYLPELRLFIVLITVYDMSPPHHVKESAVGIKCQRNRGNAQAGRSVMFPNRWQR
jgi:hypothetical protein